MSVNINDGNYRLYVKMDNMSPLTPTVWKLKQNIADMAAVILRW